MHMWSYSTWIIVVLYIADNDFCEFWYLFEVSRPAFIKMYLFFIVQKRGCDKVSEKVQTNLKTINK